MKKRVPRKLKKQFKKLWKNIYYKKVFIKKSSIDYQIWTTSNGKKVWGCETYFKFKNIEL